MTSFSCAVCASKAGNKTQPHRFECQLSIGMYTRCFGIVAACKRYPMGGQQTLRRHATRDGALAALGDSDAVQERLEEAG